MHNVTPPNTRGTDCAVAVDREISSLILFPCHWEFANGNAIYKVEEEEIEGRK